MKMSIKGHIEGHAQVSTQEALTLLVRQFFMVGRGQRQVDGQRLGGPGAMRPHRACTPDLVFHTSHRHRHGTARGPLARRGEHSASAPHCCTSVQPSCRPAGSRSRHSAAAAAAAAIAAAAAAASASSFQGPCRQLRDHGRIAQRHIRLGRTSARIGNGLICPRPQVVRRPQSPSPGIGCGGELG